MFHRNKMARHGGSSGHRGADKVGSATGPLAALEIPI
jgi:hypothetical protein